MNKFVVYTVQVGGYDVVQQPLVVDERFDYVLFTDSEESKEIGIWQVRTIPYENSDLKRVSRYPKMHPNELLNEYEASLYIDANIQITGQRIYDRVVECYEQGIDWAGIKHPKRDCIYEEAYAIYDLETKENIWKWCHFLRKDNFPRHYGLYENNIIFRTHNDVVKNINKMWWDLYTEYTRRDQLTLCYLFWKNPNIRFTYLLPEGEYSWNSSTVRTNMHSISSKSTRQLKLSFLEYAYCRCRMALPEKEKRFIDFHYWLYGLNSIKISNIMLHIWGICIVILYSAKIKYRATQRRRNQMSN